VLVEKPFTATVAEAEELIALAQKQGKQLFVFQNRRFDSDFLTVRQLIEQGLLGDIRRYEAHYNRYVPTLSAKKWKEEITPSSGILYGLGPHIIDQTIALFGSPKSVWGQRFSERTGSIIDDAFDVHLDYGKTKVHLSASLMVREDTPRYVIHGTKGSFVKYGIDPQEDHLKAGLMPDMKGFGVETPQYRGVLNAEIGGLPFRGTIETRAGNWGILFQNIADVILHGQKPLVPMADVVAQVRIMSRISF
jgi:predicted dehydrogenase